MPAPVRSRAASRPRLAALALLLGGALSAGCGTKFELPTESPRTLIPVQGDYIVSARWAGFAGASDVLLTRGGQVYVAEPRPDAPDSGRVRAYFRAKPDPVPTGVVVPDLARPARLAEGPAGELFVLDRATPPAVKRYSPSGQALRGSFSDPEWAEAVNDSSRPNSRTIRVANSRVALRGLAVDGTGAVYVAWSESTVYFDRDLVTSDTSSFLTVTDAVRKYTSDGVALLDVSTRGTGTGFVEAPGGLAASSGALLVADVEHDRVQELDANATSSPLAILDGLDLGEDPGFLAPLDVSTDDSGAVYVADTGKGRVLKYDADGTFERRVDIFDPDATGPSETEEPVAVAASTGLVFVIDRRLEMILVYEPSSVVEEGGSQ